MVAKYGFILNFRLTFFAQSLQFDLNDQARWECMFPRSTSNTDSFTNNIHADDNDENSSQQRSILTPSNQMDWFDKIS